MNNKDILNLVILLAIIWLISKWMENKVKLAGVSNKEEWEIVRDNTGKLKKIVVHRDVKQSIEQWQK